MLRLASHRAKPENLMDQAYTLLFVLSVEVQQLQLPYSA